MHLLFSLFKTNLLQKLKRFHRLIFSSFVSEKKKRFQPITMKILFYSISFCIVVIVSLFVIRVILFKSGLIYTVKKWWWAVEEYFHVYQFFKVPQFNENLQENHLYRRVLIYLNSLASTEDSDFTNLITGKKPNEIALSLDPYHQIVHDDFLGARLYWVNRPQSDRDHTRTFLLKIRKVDKRRILRPYFQHIHAASDEMEPRKRDLKLYVNFNHDWNGCEGPWRSIPFAHPSTLETIAMELDLKNKVKSDLESFLKAKQYYHRLGRVWRRSYLLYGPSGTGKSSFVAAMAKFLCYDLYDIDLSKVSHELDLRFLLLHTKSRSVILIEDLDRFLAAKSSSISLSGLLNFMDGIVSSCCCEERVMVFTMNGKEQVESSAILRPGRIDVHIQFPLCDFTSFKTLASSYLGLKDHHLFSQVEEIFQRGARMSPAEMSELMISNRNSPSRALKLIISTLQMEGHGRLGRPMIDSGPRNSTEETVGVGGEFSEGSEKEQKKLCRLWRVKRPQRVSAAV